MHKTAPEEIARRVLSGPSRLDDGEVLVAAPRDPPRALLLAAGVSSCTRLHREGARTVSAAIGHDALALTPMRHHGSGPTPVPVKGVRFTCPLVDPAVIGTSLLAAFRACEGRFLSGMPEPRDPAR